MVDNATEPRSRGAFSVNEARGPLCPDFRKNLANSRLRSTANVSTNVDEARGIGLQRPLETLT